jgi:ferredoxin
MKRQIIRIDEDRCNGCGLCIPNCPEGALQIIDGKARLVSDLFCDGLGACIGHCPEDAITIEERDAEPYDERKVMENVFAQGPSVVRAHIEHLRDHGAHEYLSEAIAFLRERGADVPIEPPAHDHHDHHEHAACGCPGAAVIDLTGEEEAAATCCEERSSRLRHWPVQIILVPPTAPYLRNADLLVAADCVPFAYADFHEDFIRGKVVLVGCPKLDDAAFYQEKLAEIIRVNEPRSITVAHMEVPCCSGLVSILSGAIAASGKQVPLEEITVTIKGEKLEPTTVSA